MAFLYFISIFLKIKYILLTTFGEDEIADKFSTLFEIGRQSVRTAGPVGHGFCAVGKIKTDILNFP